MDSTKLNVEWLLTTLPEVQSEPRRRVKWRSMLQTSQAFPTVGSQTKGIKMNEDTLVELCCWEAPRSDLSDRRDRPWDNAARRPSHADRRRSISREMLHEQFLAALPGAPNNRKFRTLAEALIALAT
jgi:hypothetical protein